MSTKKRITRVKDRIRTRKYFIEATVKELIYNDTNNYPMECTIVGVAGFTSSPFCNVKDNYNLFVKWCDQNQFSQNVSMQDSYLGRLVNKETKIQIPQQFVGIMQEIFFRKLKACFVVEIGTIFSILHNSRVHSIRIAKIQMKA